MIEGFWTLKDLQALEKVGIIAAKGVGGTETTVEVAAAAPELCRIHAHSGNVYALERSASGFRLVPIEIVYTVE